MGDGLRKVGCPVVGNLKSASGLDDQRGIHASPLIRISERIADHAALANPVVERGVGMTMNPQVRRVRPLDQLR